MSWLVPLGTYLQAAICLRSLNLRGLPLIPRRCWGPAGPYHRTAYNQFLVWVSRLQLASVRQVIDVGANRGDFAQAASTLFPTAHVLLVEPLPTLQPELKRRCAVRAGRWSVAPFALAAEVGESWLFTDSRSDQIASLTPLSKEYMRAVPAVMAGEPVACSVVTLDVLCEQFGIARIDLLKIDVEGAEFDVLQGARKILHQTEALIIEVSLIRRADAADALEKLLRTLADSGFGVIDVIPSLFSVERPWLPVEFNVLARRREVRA